MMTYFSLLTRDKHSKVPWNVAFSGYDCDVVIAKYALYRVIGWRAADLRLIRTKTALQSEIRARVAELNSRSAK
jgi:hypothetical protein